MNPQPPQAPPRENDDWIATCAIYDESRRSTVEYPDGRGGSICAMDVPVHIRDAVFVRRARDGNHFDVDPRFAFRVVSPSEAPVFRVQFHYAAPDLYLESVSVSILDYPEPWPREAERPWLEWLNKEAAKVLRDNFISYAVCEFIEYQATTFFDYLYNNETLDFTMIVSLRYPLGDGNADHMDFVGHLRLAGAQHEGKDQNAELENLSLEDFAMGIIALHWREWVEVECPICFSQVPVAEAVELSCKHFFCAECISTFTKTKVTEIHTYRINPFKCPLPSCRRELKVIGFVKKFLSEEEMEEVRLWYRNLKHPFSTALQACPRKRCGRRAMRRAGFDSHVVFCDVCGGTWCELCLERYRDAHDDCDPTLVLRLCGRYSRASDEVKAKCEEKWPWIREYAAARLDDETALKWVKENARRCPRCHTGIERSDGCFHMQCSQCATHFCYECGDELFYPYYGTHHCWENQNNLIEEQDFEFDND